MLERGEGALCPWKSEQGRGMGDKEFPLTREGITAMVHRVRTSVFVQKDGGRHGVLFLSGVV